MLVCARGKGERRKTVLVRGKTADKHLCGRTFFLFLLIHIHVKSDFQTYV